MKQWLAVVVVAFGVACSGSSGGGDAITEAPIDLSGTTWGGELIVPGAQLLTARVEVPPGQTSGLVDFTVALGQPCNVGRVQGVVTGSRVEGTGSMCDGGEISVSLEFSGAEATGTFEVTPGSPWSPGAIGTVRLFQGGGGGSLIGSTWEGVWSKQGAQGTLSVTFHTESPPGSNAWVVADTATTGSACIVPGFRLEGIYADGETLGGVIREDTPNIASALNLRYVHLVVSENEMAGYFQDQGGPCAGVNDAGSIKLARVATTSRRTELLVTQPMEGVLVLQAR